MLLVAAAWAILSTSNVAANHPNNSFTTSNGYKYTESDVRQAIAAYRRLDTDHSITVEIVPMPAVEMPRWDPVAHYTGSKKMPNGTIVYEMWVNERYEGALSDLRHAEPSVAMPIVAAHFMIALDGGFAGQKWKSYFDDARQKDSVLPDSVADRCANRRALVAGLARDQRVYGNIQIAGVMDTSGNKITAPVHYFAGLIGYAQAGVGVARLTDLLDDQQFLAQPSVQRFADELFAHFSALLPDADSRTYLAAQRKLLVVDAGFERKANARAFTQSMQALTQRLTQTQRGAFLVGAYAEQVSYNASILHNKNADSHFRASIARTSTLDASLPKLAEMRNGLAALAPGDWAKITTRSSKIVEYILAGR